MNDESRFMLKRRLEDTFCYWDLSPGRCDDGVLEKSASEILLGDVVFLSRFICL